MRPMTPTYTVELFPPLHAELLALLRRLGPDDWLRPTIAGSWRVRDIAAHLLDGNLRKLSGGRDGHRLASRPLTSFASIVDFINDLNAGGVAYAGRLSPRVLTDLLEVTGEWVARYVATLEPHAQSTIAVAWAGEDRSENWMDTGREYTERWHHQMQIREAVGAPGLLERRWYQPVLDLSVRALPRAYDRVAAPSGTAVVFEVEADGENVWSMVRDDARWRMVRGAATDPAARLRIGADAAWKLLFNALPPDAARVHVAIDGDRRLAEPLLAARAVMV
jgi:Mycothiol maleylpyruvate isomerase N-terminal domain